MKNRKIRNSLLCLCISTCLLTIMFGICMQQENSYDASVEVLEPVNSDLPIPPIEEPDITEEIIEDVSQPYTTITAEERDMLARLVYHEARGSSDECRQAVVSVIFNRLESGRWSKDVNKDKKITLYDIVYYPAAFSPAPLIKKTTATQTCYDAVDYVVEHGPTLPTYVRYFRADYDFRWPNYKNYTVIDDTYFGYFTDWEQGAW